MISARFTNAIDAPWTKVTPVKLGRVPASEPTPDCFVLVEGDGYALRCDIYDAANVSAFRDVRIWGTLVVIGYERRAHCVDLQTHGAHTHTLGSYFCGIYTDANCCLIASGEELLRVEDDGAAAWRSGRIAIAGVVVNDVTGDIIRGQAEWDPPGGWQAFEVSLATGRLANGKHH